MVKCLIYPIIKCSLDQVPLHSIRNRIFIYQNIKKKVNVEVESLEKNEFCIARKNYILKGGVDLGGGGRAYASPSGIRPPADPKGPLCAILRYPYLMTDTPKSFLKAPKAPIYTNFERGMRAEKTRFFGRSFPKITALNASFGLFFF